jgi:hypothetical protein
MYRIPDFFLHASITPKWHADVVVHRQFCLIFVAQECSVFLTTNIIIIFSLSAIPIKDYDLSKTTGECEIFQLFR